MPITVLPLKDDKNPIELDENDFDESKFMGNCEVNSINFIEDLIKYHISFAKSMIIPKNESSIIKEE